VNAAQFILVGALRLYQWLLSPAKTVLFGPASRCRYTPSCSEYALEAVRTHGACRGIWLAVGRLCRCHPWAAWGPDPVPAARPPEGQAPAPRRPLVSWRWLKNVARGLASRRRLSA
jgi:putative membrane protein insertion efficiency factor